MKNILKFEKWSRLPSTNPNQEDFLGQSRNILFSKFCLIAIIAAIVQGIHDLATGFPYVMLLDLVLVLILTIGYFLNEKRHHKFAKLLIFFGVSLLLFAFAAMVPSGVGIFILFFPLVAFSFIVMEYNDRKISYSFAVLAILLNSILLFTSYQPFGHINLQPVDPTSSFAINLIISILLLALGIDFLLKINYQAEQRLIENQIKTEKLAHVVNEKNLSLEKTNEELDRFVYSTSHDLRAPLASIMGLINLTELEKEPEPEEIKKYLGMMKDRVNNLDGFIQDIIDYSRNSRVDLVLIPVDLNNMVQEVILNNQFNENAVKVSISTKIELEDTVIIDSTRMSRVLNNLVSNAIKYNDYSKESPSVHVNAFREGDTLSIKVSDSGKGIRPEIQDKIFDMFFRGTENAEGSGLGLYIAREMILKMGGKLSFKTNLGSGTTFRIDIPLKD